MSGYQDYSAIFFALWPKNPVYHGVNFEHRDPFDAPLSRDMTRCGREIGSYNRETQRFRESGTYIPMIHAQKFGRPCKVCFPA